MTNDTKDTSAPRLRLEGEVTIYRAAELLVTIRNVVREARSCVLDLEAVTEIDSAGLQLLLAAKRSAREMGRQIEFVGHSLPVLDAAEVLGLMDELGAPVAASTLAVTPHAEYSYGS